MVAWEMSVVPDMSVNPESGAARMTRPGHRAPAARPAAPTLSVGEPVGGADMAKSKEARSFPHSPELDDLHPRTRALQAQFEHGNLRAAFECCAILRDAKAPIEATATRIKAIKMRRYSDEALLTRETPPKQPPLQLRSVLERRANGVSRHRTNC